MSAKPSRRYLGEAASKFEAACAEYVAARDADTKMKARLERRVIETGRRAFESIRKAAAALIEAAEADSLSLLHAAIGTHLEQLPPDISELHLESFARITPLGRSVARLRQIHRREASMWGNDFNSARALYALMEEYQRAAPLAYDLCGEVREAALPIGAVWDRFRDQLREISCV